MALSNEELEEILVTIRNYQKVSTPGSTDDRIAERAEESALFELQRRKHGPFTLAEAVASGRPFRRKGNRMWLRVREHCYGGIFWESSTDDGRIWEMDIIGDGEHEFELEQFTPQAITSVSYELMPEGGE